MKNYHCDLSFFGRELGCLPCKCGKAGCFARVTAVEDGSQCGEVEPDA